MTKNAPHPSGENNDESPLSESVGATSFGSDGVVSNEETGTLEATSDLSNSFEMIDESDSVAGMSEDEFNEWISEIYQKGIGQQPPSNVEEVSTAVVVKDVDADPEEDDKKAIDDKPGGDLSPSRQEGVAGYSTHGTVSLMEEDSAAIGGDGNAHLLAGDQSHATAEFLGIASPPDIQQGDVADMDQKIPAVNDNGHAAARPPSRQRGVAKKLYTDAEISQWPNALYVGSKRKCHRQVIGLYHCLVKTYSEDNNISKWSETYGEEIIELLKLEGVTGFFVRAQTADKENGIERLWRRLTTKREIIKKLKERFTEDRKHREENEGKATEERVPIAETAQATMGGAEGAQAATGVPTQTYTRVPWSTVPGEAVCFGFYLHPGTVAWKAVVKGFSDNTNDFPVWNDEIVHRVIQACHHFLVHRTIDDQPTTSIEHGRWVKAWDHEILEETRNEFENNRKAKSDMQVPSPAGPSPSPDGRGQDESRRDDNNEEPGTEDPKQGGGPARATAPYGTSGGGQKVTEVATHNHNLMDVDSDDISHSEGETVDDDSDEEHSVASDDATSESEDHESDGDDDDDDDDDSDPFSMLEDKVAATQHRTPDVTQEGQVHVATYRDRRALLTSDSDSCCSSDSSGTVNTTDSSRKRRKLEIVHYAADAPVPRNSDQPAQNERFAEEPTKGEQTKILESGLSSELAKIQLTHSTALEDDFSRLMGLSHQNRSRSKPSPYSQGNPIWDSRLVGPLHLSDHERKSIQCLKNLSFAGVPRTDREAELRALWNNIAANDPATTAAILTLGPLEAVQLARCLHGNTHFKALKVQIPSMTDANDNALALSIQNSRLDTLVIEQDTVVALPKPSALYGITPILRLLYPVTDYDSLGVSLQGNTVLRELALHVSELTPAGAQPLADGLRQSQIISLDIIHGRRNPYFASANVMERLYQGIQASLSIQNLNLHGIIGNMDDLVTIAVPKLSQVGVFQIKPDVFNNMTTMQTFVHGLRGTLQLTVLRLCHCGLQGHTDEWRLLASCIANHASLNTVDLSGNPLFGDDGVTTFVAGWHDDSNIRELILKGNNIGPHGVESLLRYHHQHLCRLDLSDNQAIGNDGLVAIGHYNLRELAFQGANIQRTLLRLCNCGLRGNTEQWRLLASSIANHASLTALDLSGNPLFGDDGVTTFVAGWHDDSNIRELILKGNNIGPLGARVLLQDRHQHLRRLDLSDNHAIGDDGLVSIGRSNLCELILRGINIGSRGVQLLLRDPNEHLRELDLSDNHAIGYDGLVTIGRWLAGSNLEMLGLNRVAQWIEYDHEEDEDAVLQSNKQALASQSLLEGVKGSFSLTSLSLEGVALVPPVHREIDFYIEANRCGRSRLAEQNRLPVAFWPHFLSNHRDNISLLHLSLLELPWLLTATAQSHDEDQRLISPDGTSITAPFRNSLWRGGQSRKRKGDGS